MKKSIYIIIIMFCLLSCKDKKIIFPEKFNAKSLEKFDLKTFNDNKKDSTYEYFVKDTIVKLYEEKEHYKKELITGNHSFKNVFIYSKTTNSLVNEFCYFYGMPIGIWKSYDEKGTLLNWKNYNEGFDFTIKDLIAMLKKELQIDLINDNNYKSLIIDRSSYKRLFFITSYCYSIQIATMAETRTIKIDGKTGEILSDVNAFIEE
ncbi:hypothetical protein [Flavobacterium pectinovorum]|uniref:Uncharacterized protein n=1 Tax=Flavobacterium pectinovorum TaxID=29533 RepID=A0A502F7I1_9FLAO|nr:hypothetical protein [Flavobacterium pectinovorum]TPG45312.1 hypothetical protein EAH81_01550 [Flavobacterium pectinovorum]